MRNRAVGYAGRVHKRPSRTHNEEVVLIDGDGNPVVINLSLVRTMTAHETRFARYNPHVFITWNDGTYSKIFMPSFEEAQNFINDAFYGVHRYNYV